MKKISLGILIGGILIVAGTSKLPSDSKIGSNSV